MCRSARHVRLPDLLMERDELAATERSDAKIPRRYARHGLLAVDEWLTEDVDDVAIRFLPGLVERRHVDRSTVLCTQSPVIPDPNSYHRRTEPPPGTWRRSPDGARSRPTWARRGSSEA